MTQANSSLLYRAVISLALSFFAISAVSPTALAAEEQTSKRIISTDSGSTELLVAFGLQDQLIAIDVTSTQPDADNPLPSVGYHRNLSAEGIMSMNPDLLVGSNHMGPDHVIRQLQQSPVQLIQLPVAHTTQQLNHNIRHLAQQLNIPQQGEALIQRNNQKQQRLDAQSLTDERAVFLLNMDSKLRMAGSKTGGGALISLTGAHNLADYDNYRSISVEALVAMQPTLILVSTRDPNEGVERFLKSNPLLQHTPAGQSGKVYAVDGRSIVSGGLSVSALTEAQRLSDLIHDRSVAAHKDVPPVSLADTGE